MRKYLEAGRLNSPRGINGEVRFDCWCDSPGFLNGIKRLYLDSDGKKSLEIKLYRPSVPSVVFVGYEDRTSASALTGRTVWFDRDDVPLPDGGFYNDDLLGLPVIDSDKGGIIGKIIRVDEGAKSFLYIVGTPDGKEFAVPAVDEFIKNTDLEVGVTVSLIDGLADM